MRLAGQDEFQARSTPQLLVMAIERLADARSSDEVVDVLRTTARRLAGADGITVVMRDGDKCFYVEEDAIGPLWKGSKFPLESCISGWAMMNAQTAVIPDIFEDERIPHELYRERFVKSLVMTPIGRQEPIAALGAYWARPYSPPQEVVDTLQTLARATATALENVHLLGALSVSLHRTELAREELRNRVGNMLAAIRSYADLALPADHAAALSKRLRSLEKVQNLLHRDFAPDAPIMVRELVEVELEAYRTGNAERVIISGPETPISGAKAMALGLVLNELASRVSRAGVLSYASGQLSVGWREQSGVVTIEWKEFGGLADKRTLPDGPELQLVRQLVSNQLSGNFRGVIDPDAVCCFIEFPADVIKTFPPNS
jgi:two-component sensor histidine kinase